MDELRKAYATLRVDPRASPREVRRQFRQLVRRWHPDRFAQDPQGQAEAARQLQQINRAYELIQAAHATREAREAPPGASPPAVPGMEGQARATAGAPLARSAIDGIVRSIGTNSAMDDLFGFLAWSWPLFVAFLVNLRHCERWTDAIERQQRGGSPPSLWLEALLGGLSLFLLFWRWRGRG